MASAAVATGHRPRPLRMLGIAVAWGSCFAVVSWGLRDAPVLWFAALRALVAGLALTAVAMRQRRPWPVGPGPWSTLALLGLVNVTLAFAAMFAGISGGTAGVAAVLANAQPLLIVVPAWLLFGQAVSLRTALALAVGSAGVVVVAVPGGGGRGAVLSLLSAAAITAGTLVVKSVSGLDVVVLSAAHFLLGGVLLAALALAVEGPPGIAWTPRFVAVLLYLGLVGTALPVLAWFVETRRCHLAQLSAWTFLVPVVGLVFSVVLLGEALAGWTVAGTALVLAALWIVLRAPEAAPAVPATTGSVRSRDARPAGPGTKVPGRLQRRAPS